MTKSQYTNETEDPLQRAPLGTLTQVRKERLFSNLVNQNKER